MRLVLFDFGKRLTVLLISYLQADFGFRVCQIFGFSIFTPQARERRARGLTFGWPSAIRSLYGSNLFYVYLNFTSLTFPYLPFP